MNGKKQPSDGQKRSSRKINSTYRDIIGLWETSVEESISDVLGSYTGKPNVGEQPEQDADDL